MECDYEKRGNENKENPSCREKLESILAVQRETRDLLSKVVGSPILGDGKDEPEPDGTLADVECGLRLVERHARLLFDMVTGLHGRI